MKSGRYKLLKTFASGGVVLSENKLSAHEGIKDLAPPKIAIIPLSMHIGLPAKPLVSKGEKVKTGQILAVCNGFVSANVHSSVSGTVIKIDKVYDSNGYKRDAFYIASENDEWIDSIDPSKTINKECSLSPLDIIHTMRDAGIVGLGGATFPSHVKLFVPKGKQVGCLIINGVECEPFLTADHALMIDKGEELLTGISILKKALQVDKAFIGIENNKPDAISNLQSLLPEFENIVIQPLKVKYPQGGEKQLIKAVLNQAVPSGGLPADTGTIVFNVATVFAVYEAVQKNKPLFQRIVTVTGKSIPKPSNFRVRIGTPIKELIEAAGDIPEDTGKIIIGGPMMGKAVSNTELPLVKGISGILLLNKADSERDVVEPCVRCSQCVNVCPMGLEPYLLMAMSRKLLFDRLQEEKVLDCIECGCCAYICPAKRPLLDFIRLGKTNVNKLFRTRKKQ